MKKIIRLTESDLVRLVKRIIREDDNLIPSSITVELTDEFIDSKELYKTNNPITMRPEIYYNLGNTEASAYEDVNVYFAVYRPDIKEIQGICFVIPGNQKGEIEWFLYLEKKSQLFPNEIEGIMRFVEKGELKLVPDFDTNFRDDGLKVGSMDHREYFEIVDVSYSQR